MSWADRFSNRDPFFWILTGSLIFHGICIPWSQVPLPVPEFSLPQAKNSISIRWIEKSSVSSKSSAKPISQKSMRSLDDSFLTAFSQTSPYTVSSKFKPQLNSTLDASIHNPEPVTFPVESMTVKELQKPTIIQNQLSVEVAVPEIQSNGIFENRKAQLLDNPAPAYPAMAIRKDWEGVVQVRVRVSTLGEPLETTIHSPSGRSSLDKAALQSVQSWRFSPAIKNAIPIESIIIIPVEFRLQNN